uniref:Uncharacterized protein n=1 Tax=Variovorax sp. HH01 TaxID=1084736 RepID=I3PCP4_9BURK|nr:hypothetical protein var074 [Variovorax sp. HH01]
MKRIGDPEVFVTWNRIGAADEIAKQYESRGIPVIVAENAAWGNEFAGRQWYSLARGMHNTAGRFPVGGPERFDALKVRLEAWRAAGERVVLPQRGIGPPGVAMPRDWPAQQVGRVRAHPGTRACVPLEKDLEAASEVVTWGSGAAIKALMWGIRVESHMPAWIGEQDNTDAGRLAMFRRLAWAQWTLQEIESGEPFERLIRCDC